MACADKLSSYAVDQVRERPDSVWLEGALRLVFDNSPDAILILNDGIFVDCNQAAVTMFGYTGKNQLLSLSPSDLSPAKQPDGSSSLQKSDEMIRATLERGNHRFEWQAKKSDGSEFPVEVLLTAIPFKGKHALYAVWRDVTRRKQAELDLLKSREREDAFRAGQSRVLEMIARGESIEDVLASLVTLIEAQSEGMLCSVVRLSEDGKHIRHGAAPNLPEIYVNAVNGAPIGPKNGSCGTAMYFGKQVIVTDMLEDPLWEDYRELARLSGLRACWSTPIFSGSGKVLGSFAMYYRQPQTPSGDEARLTEVATHIAGIAIEHQRSESELRASEQRFAKAFSANPHPMSLTTFDEGRIIEVNESLVELSGYARPELIGRASLESLWELSIPRTELIRQIRERGVARNLETRIRTRDGSLRTLLLSSLVVDIGGQSCILSVANDISERRRAEEELSLLQSITMDVALAADLESALKLVLRRVCQSTGWLLGQSWLPRADGTALECGPAWFTEAAGLDEFRRGSENVRLPPGVGLPGRVWRSKQAAWVKDVSVDTNFPRAVLASETGLKAALALPILSGNVVIAVIEFFMREPRNEDEQLVKVITAIATQLNLAIERKRAEEQLRNTQAELAHVARVTTMGELASSIAHEVNQPLGAIVGNADICLQWLNDSEPNLADLREAIEDIANDGHRASQVISRIRSLVKKQEPEKVPLDLSDVALEVLDLVNHEAQRKQVTLRQELKALPAVAADRIQLQQVLINLVMNGIEAMNSIDEGTAELVLKTDVVDGRVQATVSDCGVGIDPARLEQVFRAFHTTKSGGMGMGLAISRSIVESHGGKLWAEPNKPHGATFKLSLPIIEQVQ